MAWYGRSKFALISYRTTFTSKIVSKTSTSQVQHPISRINPHSTFIKPIPFGVSLFSPASKRVLGDFQGKGYPCTSFLGNLSVRCYYVDSQQVRHFKQRRGFVGYLANTYVVFVIVVVGAGITVAVRYGVSETIPYTKRKHLVLLSSKTERRLSENNFKKMKAAWSDRSLPPEHPECVRINKIAGNIVLSLQRGLRKDRSWTDLSYPSGATTMEASDQNVKHDEILDDDKWIHGSSTGKKGKEKGSDQYAIEHLEGLNWEVLVVNGPSVNAMCIPCGKIIVFTGLIEFLKTDAELASVVAHEVAHAVARHSAERFTKNLWVSIVELALFPFLSKDSIRKATKYLLKFPFSRKMELEADYIGLLLMASAGYDPRVTPLVHERMSKLDNDNVVLKDYRDTHPSWETRGRLVSEAKVMQEALDIYREAMAGREVEGFFL